MSATQDRAEHIAWCKSRALEYLDMDTPSPRGALGSLVSDLTKFRHTDGTSMALRIRLEGEPVAATGDVAAMRAFIEGIR